MNGHQRKETYKGQYLTDVINRRAVEDVDQLAPADGRSSSGSPRARRTSRTSTRTAAGRCGGEAVPPPRDLGRFAGTQLPRLPGDARAGRLRQARDRQRPAGARRPTSAGLIRHRYECRIETLPAVDRGVGADRRRAAPDRRARRHDPRLRLRQRHLPGPAPDPGRQGPRLRGGRAPAARRSGCRRSTRAAPQVPATIDEMTANIDYAPTFVDWAGSQSCPDRRLPGDGRALAAAARPTERLAGPPPAAPGARPERRLGRARPRDLVRFEGVRDGPLPVRRAHPVARSASSAICERPDRDRDSTTPARDPFELENLAAPGNATAASARETRGSPSSSPTLADCAGIEGRDPEPASGHYCR